MISGASSLKAREKFILLDGEPALVSTRSRQQKFQHEMVA
jgi:hypothetical protein